VLAPPPHNETGRWEGRDRAHRPGAVTVGEHGERVVRTRYRRHGRHLTGRAMDQVVVAWSSVVLGARHFRRPERRPDVVIGTVPGIPSMFAAWALSRRFRAKLVIEMRDAWPDLIAPSGMLGIRSRMGFRRNVRKATTTVVHRALSRLQSRADLVVTTTMTFAAVLRSRGQSRVAVVRNGTHLSDVDAALLETTETTEPAVHTEHPGVDRPLRVIYLGTIGRSQCLDTVVRAAALLHDEGHKVEVRIVGRGAETDKLTRLADQLNAPVTIEGGVSHAEALDLYRWADTAFVGLHGWGPFEWTIPSKVYEVMARGVPVTAALAGEFAELVRDLGAGAVVPPDSPQALADLWAQWCEAGAVPPAARHAARWVFANATWDVLAQDYAVALNRLVAA